MSHLAVYFPGGYLPSEDPFVERLAWITLRALEQTATHVEAVQYDRLPLRGGDEFREFKAGVLRDVRAALDTYMPERVTFVGKSLGTHALALVCEEVSVPADTRMIWITPVWRRDATWDAARRGRLESLYVVGSADHDYHLADRHVAVPGKTLTIADADHRLEVSGDVMATLNAWRSTVAATIDFASRRDALDPEGFSVSL